MEKEKLNLGVLRSKGWKFRGRKIGVGDWERESEGRGGVGWVVGIFSLLM